MARLRALFINVCIRENAKVIYPPVGLACIMSAVKRAGYSFDLIDMDADRLSISGVISAMQRKEYDICAFGCIVSGFGIAQKLASALRSASPSSLIVCGNTVATSTYDLLLTHTEVDVAVLGEGDITIVELFDAIAAGKTWHEVPGIAYAIGGETHKSPKRQVVANLNEIEFPDWSIFDLGKYGKNQLSKSEAGNNVASTFPLNSARGCPFDCTFCCHAFKGEPYRTYTQLAIGDEFERLTKQFHATDISFWDELSFASIARLRELVDVIEKHSTTVTWNGVTRSGLFNELHADILKRAYDAGCRTMSFSIENASPIILKAMNKNISHAKTIAHCDALWKAKITPHTSVIFGYPQETPESIRDTLDLCEKCNIYPSAGYLLPLPGTHIYQWCKDNQHITNDLEYLKNIGDRQDLAINLTQMSTTEFIECVNEGLSDLARKLGLSFDNPMKTGVYQKPKRAYGAIENATLNFTDDNRSLK